MGKAYDLDRGLEILRRTPMVLRAWLSGLPEEWTHGNEGPETWSPYDVVGHLIHGERTDWIPRARHLLSGDADTPFEPFDRFAQFDESRGKSLEELLDTFEALRAENVRTLEELDISESDLDLPGTHPELGRVTLRQHLATWVVHDLSHLAQVARVMGFQWKEEVGPWQRYLRILGDR
jgi:hypothetical protein